MKAALFGITALVLAVFLVTQQPLSEKVTIVHDAWKSDVEQKEPVETIDPVATTSAPATLLFVGDIMLARAVEMRMEQFGIGYPFESLRDTLSTPDVTIGNFEGVVTPVHYPTPNFTFQFSVKPEYLTSLKTAGFDVLSLANNHTLDYGTTSLAYTRALCEKSVLVCGGEPKGLSALSTQVVSAGAHRVGILFIHTLYGAPATSTLKTYIEKLNTESDVQVAYIHWGEEYVLVHNEAQEVLGKALVDMGMDAVIGHHPHVVQDVALYKDKPIFYSLGNFVFDQFFSNDVQEMLGVHMTIEDAQITYTLVPFSSIDTRSQPHHADTETATALRERILSTVATDLRVEVLSGTIMAPR
jgi:gamma-polyglutamate biosynthesis protein CapA